MSKQLAKRATSEWVEYVLERFNDRALSEKWTSPTFVDIPKSLT